MKINKELYNQFEKRCKMQGTDPDKTLNKMIADYLKDKYCVGENYAVLVSPGYGAGFSTWTGIEAHNGLLIAYLYEKGLIMNDEVVYPEKREEREKIENEICELTEEPNAYLNGLWDCVVCWVADGSSYKINEHDGYESIDTFWR